MTNITIYVIFKLGGNSVVITALERQEVEMYIRKPDIWGRGWSDLGRPSIAIGRDGTEYAEVTVTQYAGWSENQDRYEVTKPLHQALDSLQGFEGTEVQIAREICRALTIPEDKV